MNKHCKIHAFGAGIPYCVDCMKDEQTNTPETDELATNLMVSRSGDAETPNKHMPPKTAVSQTKQFRKDLDGILQELKSDSHPTAPHEGARSSRERSIAVTKIQEAIMWLGMDLKAINEESPSDETTNPYPQSYNPESPVIEPTADGLKL